MANFPVLDANGDLKYLSSDGAGTNGDPNVVIHTVKQTAHDNLNANANIQVGNADVGAGNPVPISDNGGSVTVDQPTRANLNANATAQVAGVDASQTNPVPTYDAGAVSGGHQYTTSADMSAVAANVTALPGSGKRIVVKTIVVSAAAAALKVTFKEQTSGTVVMVVRVPANTTVVVPFSGKVKLPTADRLLQAQTDVAGTVDITVSYLSE